MAIDRSPLQPSIDCVKHIYSAANGGGSYQSLHSILYLSNQIPCLITEPSGPLLLLMTFIDKSNSGANLRRCGLKLQMCASHIRVYLLCVRVQADSCALYPFSPPLGILMKRRPLQTCGACPTTAPVDSEENFNINDLCCICIQT